jgi:hypothetical protein
MVNNRRLEVLLEDLSEIFKEDSILAKDLSTFLSKIKTKEVKNYIESLVSGSKPEQALREVFFTINSILSQYLFKDVFPEVGQENGFIDYLIKDGREEISLEIKPLHNGVFKKQRAGKIFAKLKKGTLKPEAHTEQIQKYLSTTRDYVVLSNLEDWYFFSKTYSLGPECSYFLNVNLFELIEEFEDINDFWQYIDQKEHLSGKEPLDQKFFEMLRMWVKELEEVKFNVDESRKIELIINLINKFIFIQSLDNFWIIEKDYILDEWSRIERRWAAKKNLMKLTKFLHDINEYFYYLYDTELFKIIETDKTIIDFLDQEQENIDIFHQKLMLILGVEYGTDPTCWIPGIIQFNFRRIDEDILGKSYETFLAEIRKERGIYYTPKYITKYIVDNTAGKLFTSIIEEFKKQLEQDKFEECEILAEKFINIKVLDPACGSGSFLIKALKLIWAKYQELYHILDPIYKNYADFKDTLVRDEQTEKAFEILLKIRTLLVLDNKRLMISKIIIRHIYGCDLDKKALEVAKLNIWLEAIRLAPEVFQYNKLPSDTRHILPDLEMNLGNGDSLVSLPDDRIIEYMKDSKKEFLETIFKLRTQFLEDPTDIDILKQITTALSEVKKELFEQFSEFLLNNEISETLLDHTIPFFWPLNFWFVFFNKDDLSRKEHCGFDAIVGNPPYFTIRGKGTGTLVQAYCYEFLQNSTQWKEYFRSQSDIYYYFIIKSIELLAPTGEFGFIIEDYWIENDYADKLKQKILNNCILEILIRFGKVKKIFEDADNNTCILIFQSIKSDSSSFKYVYCKKNYEELTQQLSNQKLLYNIIENIDKEDFSNDYIDIYWIEQKGLTTKKWILSRLHKIDIIKKIEANKRTLKDICNIGQGVVPGRKKEFRIVGDQNSKEGEGYCIAIEKNFIEVVDRKTAKTHRLEKEFIKPLINNSGIKKFITDPSRDYLIYTVPFQEKEFEINNYPGILNYLKNYEHELKERYDYDGNKYPWYGYQRIQNREIFENSDMKILSAYRAIENQFALDEIGYYGTTDMYAIVPKEDSVVNLYYLLALLNSKVLTYWYKIAGKSKGNILEFFKTPLERMPVLEPSEDIQNEISKIVKKLILIKTVNQKFRELWQEISEKYRTGTIELQSLIYKSKSAIQNGAFEEIIISDISLSPDSDDPLIEKNFERFSFGTDNDLNLKIFGILDSTETLILEVKTKTKEFRDLIYLDICRLIDSKRKVNCLKDIFTKAEISIIKPNIWEKSHNLLEFTVKRLEDWVSNHKISNISYDIIKQEEEIRDTENKIDARFLKLYDLSEEEVKVVSNSLNLLEKVKKTILNFYLNP